MSSCIFCEIVAGSRPAYPVLDEEHCLAFLDQRPLFPGHCLLIPKKHHETLQELPGGLIEPLFRCGQRLSRAIEAAMGAEGIFVGINNRVSQSVPHLHIHVVPRRAKDGLRGFFWPRSKYVSDADAIEAQQAIRQALETV
jgi:histidine triad (HIT) family protein